MKHLKTILMLILVLFMALMHIESEARPVTRRNSDNFRYSPLEVAIRESNRNLIPPGDLIATVIDQVNVQLIWSTPTDLVHLYYHDGIPADGYYQLSSEAYGTIFNLLDYPDATLEYIDFRHSPWGLNGTWEYSILLLDWDEGVLLYSFDNLYTNVNNGWEVGVSLNSNPGVERVGIFIIPLGNNQDDAYPVIDTDFQMDGVSYVINATTYAVVEIATGDFLIDLWIREASGPTRRVTASDPVNINSYSKSTVPLRQDLLGYKIYRNTNMINEITDPAILTYLDQDLPDGSYTYYVTAIYDEGESEPSNTATVNINAGIQVAWSDNFDSYEDFTGEFPPWTLYDLDGAPTYGFNNISFPGEYQPMSFIIFNPSQTVPPMTDLVPPSGQKVVAAFASTTAQNNDWMISPLINLGTESSITFKARSYSAQYGLERLRVGISITEPDPGSFSIISPGQYIQVPVAWTEFTFDLSDYDQQQVYLALNYVSHDSWALFIDDFKVLSIGGSEIDENVIEQTSFISARNFPNPFNPETTIEFTLSSNSITRLEIFNIRGQQVALLIDEYLTAGMHRINWSGRDDQNREVMNGIYFYRITSGEHTQTGKMMLLK